VEAPLQARELQVVAGEVVEHMPDVEDLDDEPRVEVQDMHDPHGLLTESDEAGAEVDDLEETEVEDENLAEPGDIFWAKERRGSYWPCQAVPLALVPPRDVRRFGSLAGADSMIWVKLFGREEHKPMAPWSLTPLLGSTPFDLAAKGTEHDRMVAYDMALVAKLGI
jgi:hypothetical protein